MTATATPAVESFETEQPQHAVPRWVRVMGFTGRLLVGTGIVLALFAAFQLWGTGVHEARAQSSLRDEFATRLEVAQTRIADLVPAPPEDRTDDPEPAADESEPDREPTEPTAAEEPGSSAEPIDPGRRGGVDPEVLALLFPADGDAVARIEIPALDVDKVVVRGIHVADLRKGPGLYPSTALPGNLGNAAIAGHRTTYGAPFGRIDELVPGDEITVTTIQGRFTYRVAVSEAAFGDRAGDVAEFGVGHAIVRPGDTWVLDDFGDSRLTLTACHPKYSARQRIVVAAELVSEPVALPEEVMELLATMEAAALAGEDLTAPDAEADDGPDADTAPAAAGPVAFDLSSLGRPADLDEGLGGDRGAIPGALGWLVVTVAIWLVGARVAARQSGWKRRLAPYGAALLPAAIALWMCFEAADRALPAY